MKNHSRSVSSIGLLLAVLLGCFDTAHAQNTLTSNPSQLTFDTESGVTTPSQSISLLSSTPVSVAVSAVSAGNWLSVSPGNGTTPLQVTVSIGSGAPTSGTSAGFINVTSSAGSLIVPVTLNANSPGASPLSATPNSLSFTFPPNSTAPNTLPISVSSSSSSINTFTVSSYLSSGANWLTLNPTSGPVPGSFNVTVSPTALPAGPGTFDAAVAINAPGTTGTIVPVLVTVQGVPSINVTPSQLSFGFQTGTTAPASQTLSVASSTGSNVGFDATTKTSTCGTGWLVLSQSSGATPSTLTVSVNVSSLSQGTCSGEVDISAPSATNSSVVVPVTLLVSNSPLLQVPSTGPTFNYQIGSAAPSAQNVQITSTTSGVAFNASATPISGQPSFLQVSPASGTTPQSISLSLNSSTLATLANGTYTENVTIASTSAGNSPQTFPVTLVVSSTPTLISTAPVPNGLTFNYQIGQATPNKQTVTISSSGAPLNYQIQTTTTNCSGFLNATPASGSTFGNQDQVFVSVITTGLHTPQVCDGTVVLTVPGTSTSLQIPVTLNVSTGVLLNVGQSAINVTAVAGSTTATQQHISVTSTDNSVQSFNATASTNPPGLTWLAVSPNSGNTPQNVQVTINPTGLAIGVYTGSILIQGTGTASSAPAQTIPVTLTIASAAVTATPTSLNFTQSAGGSAPANQTIQINGVPSGTTIGASGTQFNGTGTWLSVSASGNTVTVGANGSLLTQGAYNGVVTVIVPGAQGSPLNIPVTLNVTAAAALSVSPTTASFNYQLGMQGTLTNQSIQVTSTSGSVPVTAAVTPITGGNFLLTSFNPGQTTPTTLILSLSVGVVAALAPGNYTDKVVVSSTAIPNGDQTVTVNLTVTAGVTPVVTSITNAASLQPGPIAPGEIITIFGTNVGPAAPSLGTGFQPTSNGTVPTTLAGTTVTINGVEAPLIFVAPNQINAIAPYELFGQTTANVTVSINDATSASFQAQVVQTAPSIFSLTFSGNGQGAILNQNNTVNGTSNPAAKGSVIQIFATGEGQLVPGVQTGCITGFTVLPKPVATPITVTIGGQPATPINYAGEAPGEVCGLLQVNATVPTNIGSGPQQVVLTIGSATNSQQNITVAVQ